MEKTKSIPHGLKAAAGISSLRSMRLWGDPYPGVRVSPGQKASSWLGDQYVVLTGSIIMRRRLTPTLFTILMERWMCAAVPGATLTGIIC